MIPTVLITGGSLGIGYELAKQFAADGFRLVLVAKPAEELAIAKKELEANYKVEVITFVKNLATATAATELYEWTKTLPFQIDILVNNAGFGTGGYIMDVEMEREVEMIHLNVLTVYQLTRLFLQDMVARDSGKIMNVASIAAFQPSPALSTYAATKSFVYSFTVGISYELKQAKSKVHLMALCPPPAHTGFQKAAKLDDSKLYNSVTVVPAAQIAQRGYRALMRGKIWIVPDHFVDFLMEMGNRLFPSWLKLKMTYNTSIKGKMF
jgi:short-subunit dehydrogenase